MAKYIVEDTRLTAIANAIRAKTGKSASLTLAQMPTEIESIEGGTSTDTSELEAQIAELTTNNTELKELNSELESDNIELNSENAQLKTQNAELTEALEDAQAEITDWQDQYEDAEDQVRALTTQVKTLTAENAELQARIEELEGGSSGSENSFPTAAAGVYEHGSNFTTSLYAWDDVYGNNDYESDYNINDYSRTDDDWSIDGWVGGDVVIADGVTCLYDFACGNIVIPASMTDIQMLFDFKHEYCFPDSTIDCHMETIYIKATTPPSLNAAFTSEMGGEVFAPYLTKIVVPKGCGDAYRSATNWSASADIIVEVDE